ncbi:GNAT family N-acetyltransferase [Nocardioides bigeumensis]
MGTGIEVTVCESDTDYEDWRQVRLAVVPEERCPSVAELKALTSPEKKFYVARAGGEIAGSGMADRSEVGDGGAIAPRVLPDWRRRGVGTALLVVLSQHCADLGLREVRASAEDAASLAFASKFGFVEIDREVEQLYDVGDEPDPGPPPHGLELVTAAERPGLWADCYDSFGREVLADFALHGELQVSAAEWVDEWGAAPMFLALHDGEVVGCAGLLLDDDQPARAENALTGVRRDWRGRGVATHLKRHTLHWASTHGIREVYTWTQNDNAAMRWLNELLGYRTGSVGITLSADLPLRAET